MALVVIGYVDGDPVYFEEPEPTQFTADAEVNSKTNYEVEVIATDEYGNSDYAYGIFYVPGEWIEPITNRTRQDVLNKNSLRGYLNYWDLNRIEIDTQYLFNILLFYSYGSTRETTHKTDWVMADFLYMEDTDAERIRLNVDLLTEIYYPQGVLLPDTLQNPDWRKINAVESILKNMKDMLTRMEQSFRYSGTFNSGQEVVF
jgi:hypothetical protein